MIKPINTYSEYNNHSRVNNQPTFTGINANRLTTKIINNTESISQSKLGRKLLGLLADAKKYLSKGSRELPITEKPVKANLTYNEKTQKELEKKAKEWQDVKFRKLDSEKKIKDAGHDPKPGDLDEKGYLSTSGKDKVEKPSFKGAEDINTDNVNNDFGHTQSKNNIFDDENIISRSDLSDDINDIDVISDSKIHIVDNYKSKTFEDLGFNHKENWDLGLDDLSPKMDVDIDSDIETNFLGKLGIDKEIGVDKDKFFDFDFDINIHDIWGKLVDWIT